MLPFSGAKAPHQTEALAIMRNAIIAASLVLAGATVVRRRAGARIHVANTSKHARRKSLPAAAS